MAVKQAAGKNKKKAESSGAGATSTDSGAGGAALGGVVMSSEMRAWCKAEMKKITGSDDLSLVEFCYSLESDAEIKEYLKMYLGSSEQVSAFAADFTLRKDF